jgi:hypothetical protein
MEYADFSEQVGSNNADQLATGTSQITYALGGNDQLSGSSGAYYNLQVGGQGSDTYMASPGGTTTVIDNGGTADTLVATGLGLTNPNTFVATTNAGQHLIAADLDSGQAVLVADWASTGNQIETVQLADGTYSIDEIQTAITTSPNNLGDVSTRQLIDVGLLPTGTTATDIDTLLSQVRERDTALSSQPASNNTENPMATVTDHDIAELYVALFGRAPDADGLAFWVDSLQSGAETSLASVAQSMFETQPAREYYPLTASNETIVASFYENVLGRTADADGLAFWTDALNNGRSFGDLVVDMIQAVRDYNGPDAAALESKALFTNRSDVAEHYGAVLDGNVEQAQAVLEGITSATDTSTPEAIESAIYSSEGLDNIYTTYSDLSGYPSQWELTADGSGMAFVTDGYDYSNTYSSNDIVINIFDEGLAPTESVRIGDAQGQSFESFTLGSNNNFLIHGTDNVRGDFVLEYSPSDGVKNVLSLSQQGNIDITAMTQRPDGKFVLAGDQNVFGDTQDAFAMVLNEDLSIAHQVRIDDPGTNSSYEEVDEVVALNDNGLLVRDDDLVMRFDSNLNLINQKDFSTGIQNISQLDNGTLVGFSTYDQPIFLDDQLNVTKALGVTISGYGNIDQIDIQSDGKFSFFENYDERIFSGTITDANEMVIDSVKTITSREGYDMIPDEVFRRDDLVYAEDSGEWYKFEVAEGTQPNLGGDQRIYEGDVTQFTYVEYAQDDYNYPTTQAGTFEASAVDLSGTSSFDFSVEVTGTPSISEFGQLDMA